MSEVYILIREGVYRHEILGVFLDLSAANESANELIKSERDSYHCITVYLAPIGATIEDAKEISSRDKTKSYLIAPH